MISPAAQYSGTPAEVVDGAELDRIAQLLAELMETPWQPAGELQAGPASEPAGGRGGQGLAVFSDPAALRIYGVSGAERTVRGWIQRQLPAWTRDRASIDEKGNLVVQLGRKEKPRAVFIAHMDEIGFEVTHDAGDRFVPAESRGGGMPELFAWHPFWVHTAARRLPAVMTRLGNLDIGPAAQDGTVRVAGGDTATVRKRFRPLLGNRVTARSLDDRVGCAALLAVLQGLNAAEVRRFEERSPVWFVFSVEEESGLVGGRFDCREHFPAPGLSGGQLCDLRLAARGSLPGVREAWRRLCDSGHGFERRYTPRCGGAGGGVGAPREDSFSAWRYRGRQRWFNVCSAWCCQCAFEFSAALCAFAR